VVGCSKEKIVVAADSRTHYFVSGKSRDDECKIVAIKHDLLFVPIGTTGNQFAKSALNWDATDQARIAANQTANSVQEISSRWGESMERRFVARFVARRE
jgi:hypothetical protein